MWWVIGLALYLFLFTLGVMFLKGAARLDTPEPPSQAVAGGSSRDNASPDPEPQPARLPEVAVRRRSLRAVYPGLTAAVADKVAGLVAWVTSAMKELS